MRAVIQRVIEASVMISENIHGQIGNGFLILLGIEDQDNEDDARWLASKIAGLRVFDDEQNMMNLDLKATGGKVLLISQFTLHASTRKGNRPSFIKAAKPEKAEPLYEFFLDKLRQQSIHVESGVFGALMKVSLINDGPVTIIIDTKRKD